MNMNIYIYINVYIYTYVYTYDISGMITVHDHSPWTGNPILNHLISHLDLPLENHIPSVPQYVMLNQLSMYDLLANVKKHYL